MMKNGFYRYDPTNYHGPLHFYILFLSQTLFGRNIWALRLPVVLASIASIFADAEIRAAGRAARSAGWPRSRWRFRPGFVFYGRYSIHEVWLLLFSMLFILGLLGLWRFGSASYLWCVGMGMRGMILTKETYIIHMGCAVIAAGVPGFRIKITPLPEVKRGPPAMGPGAISRSWPARGIFFIVFFYSGTFLNWPG